MSRVTPKEHGLIKGALRRIFARSPERKHLIEACIVPTESVPIELRVKRKRVKTWVKTPCCGELTAKSALQVDHIEPVIPLDKTVHDFTVTELVDRIWCENSNLQVVCKTCHEPKTKAENEIRKQHRKAKREAAKRERVDANSAPRQSRK